MKKCPKCKVRTLVRVKKDTETGNDYLKCVCGWTEIDRDGKVILSEDYFLQQVGSKKD